MAFRPYRSIELRLPALNDTTRTAVLKRAKDAGSLRHATTTSTTIAKANGAWRPSTKRDGVITSPTDRARRLTGSTTPPRSWDWTRSGALHPAGNVPA